MSDKHTRLGSAALAYAQRLGWPVFPLTPGTKVPVKGTHGFKDASTDPAVIETWWQKWPGANIGLDCGGAELVVIDLDVKGEADGLESWRELKTRLGFDDSTLASRTPSGGRHLFFQRPAGVQGARLRNSVGKLGPGIDVRVQGGYVVAPPSTTAEGDYTWEEGVGPENLEPMPVPPALLRSLAGPSGPTHISSLQDLATLRAEPALPGTRAAHPGDANAAAQAELQEELDALSLASTGDRNNRLNIAAYKLGRLVGGGELDRGQVVALLTQRAKAIGLGAFETRRTLQSGLAAGMDRPRRAYRRHTQGGSTTAASPRPHGAPRAPGVLDSLTDLGNAERLVARHGQDLCYCHPWGKWLIWDGRHWRPDASGEVVRRATEAARSIREEAAQAEDAQQRNALAKWATRSAAEPRINAMIRLAQSFPGIPVQPDELDADDWLLTVENGTLDLRLGELLPHRRADMITRLAPVAYDPEAQGHLWLSFLDRIMASNERVIAFLQRAVGYSLTGDTREQKFFVLHGSGANGKSTFLETLGHLLGDYAQTTPTATLLRTRGRQVPNDLARLHGARLVVAVEAEEGQWLAESLIKQMTGGDRIAARFLYREYFEFVPRFKLFLATNHKPQIRGTDQAIWRRIRLVPFRVSIPDAEQDRKLGEKLRAELPGILAWAVRGCQAWQQVGLGTPSEVRRATAGYQGDMDPLATFLKDCCVRAPSAQATIKALYETYLQWCQANGEQPLSKRVLGNRLRDQGLEVRRGTGGVRSWRGLGLRASPKQLGLSSNLDR